MGYSQVVYSSMALVDIIAPGSPLLAIARVGQREIEARVTLPDKDSDGGALTGMTELLIACLEESVVGENPFSGVAGAQIASFAEGKGGKSSTIFLTDGDGGKLKATRFSNLAVGKVYWVAAVVKDDSQS